MVADFDRYAIWIAQAATEKQTKILFNQPDPQNPRSY
jgi:hypothetical protein